MKILHFTQDMTPLFVIYPTAPALTHMVQFGESHRLFLCTFKRRCQEGYSPGPRHSIYFHGARRFKLRTTARRKRNLYRCHSFLCFSADYMRNEIRLSLSNFCSFSGYIRYLNYSQIEQRSLIPTLVLLQDRRQDLDTAFLCGHKIKERE